MKKVLLYTINAIIISLFIKCSILKPLEKGFYIDLGGLHGGETISLFINDSIIFDKEIIKKDTLFGGTPYSHSVEYLSQEKYLIFKSNYERKVKWFPIDDLHNVKLLVQIDSLKKDTIIDTRNKEIDLYVTHNDKLLITTSIKQ